ncbi:hypothetical protein FACS1894217_08280 [Clostridia bacterium]|nr:hypothetical protein FACS1894217_08280 [Clostridia bacterium]
MNEEAFERDLRPDDGLPLPPLADPVISMIFKNEDVSGLAMLELVNAVLADSGDKPISQIINVTPQPFYPDAQSRSYRVDVTAKTDDNELIILEVQLSSLLVTNERALIYSEQSLADNALKGDTWKDIDKSMPRVVFINLLDFDMRKNGRNFHQVAELTYREEPRELASERFGIHNLELKKYRKIQPDFSNSLHCWLTAICRSQDTNKSLKEVVDMEAALRDYAAVNPGFSQFVDRYELASADNETRKMFRKWEHEQSLAAMERQMVRRQGRSEGLREGRIEQFKLALGDRFAFGDILSGIEQDEFRAKLMREAAGLGISAAQMDELYQKYDKDPNYDFVSIGEQDYVQ